MAHVELSTKAYNSKSRTARRSTGKQAASAHGVAADERHPRLLPSFGTLVNILAWQFDRGAPVVVVGARFRRPRRVAILGHPAPERQHPLLGAGLLHLVLRACLGQEDLQRDVDSSRVQPGAWGGNLFVLLGVAPLLAITIPSTLCTAVISFALVSLACIFSSTSTLRWQKNGTTFAWVIISCSLFFLN